MTFRVTAETPNSKGLPLPAPPQPRITKANYRRARVIIRSKIKRWCLDNPGFSLTKRGPGARNCSEETKKYLIESSVPTIRNKKYGNCLSFAISNAASQICGAELGDTLMKAFLKESFTFRSIGSSQRFLHTVHKQLNFRKVSDPEFQKDKMKWLCSRYQRLWITRIHAGNEVDHCVLVDGNQNEILDSEEKKPMRIFVEALRSCVGTTDKKVYVAEVRELTLTK
ncbi:unnamed protein product [Agarophyton chilense]